ncbi:hypothetical protein RIF29_28862 [Crotalaria pallida]|uniref:Uncharacterized protein n=1 Tax=Crotalaria pallida TaxID=3830 RepID=A0AAN9EDF7_CROPI
MTTNDNNVLSQIAPKAWINDFGATSSGPSPPGQSHSHPPGTTSSGPSPPGQGHSQPGTTSSDPSPPGQGHSHPPGTTSSGPSPPGQGHSHPLEQQAQVHLLLVKAIVTHPSVGNQQAG